MNRFLLLSVLLAGCATTEAATTRSSEATSRARSESWFTTQIAASGNIPSTAIERARRRLHASGFSTNLAALLGEEPSAEELLLSDDRRDPGRCFGTTEVISVNARAHSLGSLLNFSCVTAAWSEPEKAGDACVHRQTPGCPVHGDRALAEMALDAVSSL